MPLTTSVVGATDYALQEALTAYSDEAYTNARKLSGTGIVGSNPGIDVNTETFVGQMRWRTPVNPTINIASITDSTDGTVSTYGTGHLKYVKSLRTFGARKINMKQVVTQEDGLIKMGRDFGEIHAQDEHNAILAVLKGVAASEALNGAAAATGQVGLGGQTFAEASTSDMRYGFYVDLGAVPIVKAYDNTKASMEQGAQRAEGMLQALGKAWKDYEPEYAYLVCDPETMASFRSANLVDQDRVRDGTIDFQTLFNGKFRLIQTRATQSLSSAEMININAGGGVDIAGTKCFFIVLPGALVLEPMPVPDPVEIYRRAAGYKGGGTTEVWHRWGYILHPAGYDWAGSSDKFVADAEYGYAVEAGTPGALASANTLLTTTTGSFIRKTTSTLSLGILPVFHG